MSKWITEGELVEELSEKMIFQNSSIKEFLESDRNFWLISSKGMGKTLLLRYKKKLAQVSAKTKGIIIIPEHKGIDNVKLPPYLAKENFALFEKVNFWKDVWEASIATSALFHFPLETIESWEKKEINLLLEKIILPAEIKSDLNKRLRGERCHNYNPSEILSQYLMLGTKSLQQLRSSSMPHIQRLYTKTISSGIYVFIDRFDQALMEKYPNELDIWVNGQLGLLLSCREINLNNQHIKIYTSIRQEAFSKLTDESRTSILGSILLLKYSKEELKNIFEKSINYYEKKETIEDFLGCKKIKNQWVMKEEGPFDYICRHTTGTPRGIVVLGRAISNVSNRDNLSDREETIRNEVNIQSSDEIINGS
jgi:hypothetical protein